MNIRLNKRKSIGKVLYIVEGSKTEPNILYSIFVKIFDYQFERILRDKGYHKYNSKENPYSQVFVINAEESNIKNIAKDNLFLDNLFAELIENYDFDVDNAAIYYIFDRDNQSNTDTKFIESMLSVLANSRDNSGYDRQGLLLLSYPAIESFILSCFQQDSFQKKFNTGNSLKQYLYQCKTDYKKITEDILVQAVQELCYALKMLDIGELDIDDFSKQNREIYQYEECSYDKEGLYQALSLLCISLLDLGLIEIEKNDSE